MMRRSRVTALCAGWLLATAPGCVVFDIHEELQMTNAELARINERLEAVESELTTLTALKSLDESMASSKVSLEALDEHLASLRKTIESIDATIPFLSLSGDGEEAEGETPGDEAAAGSMEEGQAGDSDVTEVVEPPRVDSAGDA